MKIFATIFPFVEPSDRDFRMGRYIANYDFLVALLRYGDFDSYHLFCLNPQHLQATAQKLTEEPSIDTATKQKIQLFLYTSLREKLETEHYHVFHLGGWGYFFAGLAQLRSRYGATPFPITGLIHSLNAREARFDYYKLLRAPLAPCDAVVCTSQAGRQVMAYQLDRIAQLEQCPAFAGQLPVIPLGTAEATPPDRVDSRRQLGLDDNTVALLYIGRLSPNTKADLYPLLIGFKQLLTRQTQPLRLILAGGADSGEQSLHRDMIAELDLSASVMLLANFDPAMKAQLYGAADIAVAPSDNLQETFGLSIIEAMQAGLPVVAADLNGYRDLIDDGGDGYRIRTTWIDRLELAEMDEIMATDTLQTLLAQAMVLDLEQLQLRLQTLIDDADLRRRLGDKGRQKVRDRYLWPTVINHYLDLWQQLSEQAGQCDFAMAQTGLFSNDYLGAFSGYPSALLDRAMPVRLTAAGRESLTSGRTPPIYSEVAMLLDQDWLAAAMGYLEERGGEGTAGELLDQCGDKANRGRFSLMWAAKYGLLGLGEG